MFLLPKFQKFRFRFLSRAALTDRSFLPDELKKKKKSTVKTQIRKAQSKSFRFLRSILMHLKFVRFVDEERLLDVLEDDLFAETKTRRKSIQTNAVTARTLNNNYKIKRRHCSEESQCCLTIIFKTVLSWKFQTFYFCCWARYFEFTIFSTETFFTSNRSMEVGPELEHLVGSPSVSSVGATTPKVSVTDQNSGPSRPESPLFLKRKK